MATHWASANAHGKINLTLDVGEKRADGYHSLRTVFLQIAPCDKVRVALSPETGIRLDVSGNAPSGPDNLAYQAAERWLTCTGAAVGVQITLEKELPVGAGLGGGSSDAAAVLMLLNHLLPHPETTPDQLAGELGADVAFFLQGGCALGEGRGEVLSPLPQPIAFPLVVASPGVGISTAWAYRELDRKRAEGQLRPGHATAALVDAVLRGDDWRPHISNDFEPVILGSFPEVAAAKRTLTECGARAAMLCGSGDSVFGVFDTEEDADHAVDRLVASGCWCRRG